MLRQIIISIILLVCVSSCSIIYTPSITQGTNFTSNKDIKQNLTGKTRGQIFLELGKPMLELNAPDQIIYVHSTRTGHQPTKVKQLIITLKDGTATNVEISESTSNQVMKSYLTAEK